MVSCADARCATIRAEESRRATEQYRVNDGGTLTLLVFWQRDNGAPSAPKGNRSVASQGRARKAARDEREIR